jgi:hypothetical protein
MQTPWPVSNLHEYLAAGVGGVGGLGGVGGIGGTGVGGADVGADVEAFAGLLVLAGFFNFT